MLHSRFRYYNSTGTSVDLFNIIPWYITHITKKALVYMYVPTSLADRLYFAAIEALECGDKDTTTSFCFSGWLGDVW